MDTSVNKTRSLQSAMEHGTEIYDRDIKCISCPER